MPIITVQLNHPGDSDNFIAESNPTRVESVGKTELHFDGEINKKLHLVLRFDLSSLPLNATINSAELSLYKSNNESSTSVSSSVYRITNTGFVDGQVSWNDKDKLSNVPWVIPGLGSSDYSIFSAVYKTLVIAGGAEWHTWDVTPQITELGNTRIYELVIKSNTNNKLTFRSSSETVIANRPKLVIDYTEGVAPTYEEFEITQTGTLLSGILNSIAGDVTVNWGDTSSTVYAFGADIEFSHTYASIGPWNVTFTMEYLSNLQKLEFTNGNIDFDLSDISSTSLESLSIPIDNTVSGSVADLPEELLSLTISGSNNVSGTTGDLPGDITSLILTGNTTLSGQLYNLPAGLTYLNVTGNNTLLGDTSDFPTGLTDITIIGSNTISGDIANLPSGLLSVYIDGLNTLSGDIYDLPSDLTIIYIAGNNTIEEYTFGRTWASDMETFYIRQVSPYGFSTAEVDRLLIDLNNTTWISEFGLIDLMGTNSYRSHMSDTSYDALVAQPVTVNVNGLLDVGILEVIQSGDTVGGILYSETDSIIVDWGDDSTETFPADTAINFYHAYDSSNTWTINISVEDPLNLKVVNFNTGDIYFDLSALYSFGITDLLVEENTITGSITDIPLTMTKFYIAGNSVIDGNISDLPSSLTDFFMSSEANTITGDIATLPTGLLHFICSGGNTLNGDVFDLPVGLIDEMIINGTNTVSGDIADLPVGLTNVTIQGNNTLSGDIADFGSILTEIIITGVNTITGDITDLPSSLETLTLSGHNTVSGDINNFPSTISNIAITGYNTISDYTSGRTWSSPMQRMQIDAYSSGLSTEEIDNLLEDLSLITTWNGTNIISLLGTHEYRSYLSDNFFNTLTVNGVTVLVNGRIAAPAGPPVINPNFPTPPEQTIILNTFVENHVEVIKTIGLALFASDVDLSNPLEYRNVINENAENLRLAINNLQVIVKTGVCSIGGTVIEFRESSTLYVNNSTYYLFNTDNFPTSGGSGITQETLAIAIRYEPTESNNIAQLGIVRNPVLVTNNRQYLCILGEIQVTFTGTQITSVDEIIYTNRDYFFPRLDLVDGGEI